MQTPAHVIGEEQVDTEKIGKKRIAANGSVA